MDRRVFAVRFVEAALRQAALNAAAQWKKEVEARCIHLGKCGDPLCSHTGEDEK